MNPNRGSAGIEPTAPAMDLEREAKIADTKDVLRLLSKLCMFHRMRLRRFPSAALVGEWPQEARLANQGIESLVLELTRVLDLNPPFLDIRSVATSNTDADFARTGEGEIDHDRPLLEVADAWGNPIVYFNNFDGEKAQLYYTRDFRPFKASIPLPSSDAAKPKTGFSLWSIGPNGVNEDRSGDDITVDTR